jgi:hypothetical protein
VSVQVDYSKIIEIPEKTIEDEKSIRIKKDKELLFGLTTPEKSEKHSRPLSEVPESIEREITAPEDLYPKDIKKKNPLDNTGLIEALNKHHTKVENDDLNFNSEDERDISEMQQNTNL